MHHKFVVIDFDKPTARVYLGSYNFSIPADKRNGENLLVIRDRRIAVSYTVEALRIFDHYHFRVTQREAKAAGNNWSSPNRREALAKRPGSWTTTLIKRKIPGSRAFFITLAQPTSGGDGEMPRQPNTPRTPSKRERIRPDMFTC